MRTEIISSRIKLLLLVLIAVFGAAGSRAGVISQYPPTNTINGPDFIFLSPVTNTSPTNQYGNANVTASNVVQSQTFSSNRTFLRMHVIEATNWIALQGGISSTNGNFWLYIPNAADFAKIGLGDQIVSGVQQYLVVGLTNGNQTVAFVNASFSCPTQTAAPATNYPIDIELQDSIPRRTGGMDGDSIFLTANYSIGNNGGIQSGMYFMDGIDSSSIINYQGVGTPNYLGLSCGIGRSIFSQQQLQIFSGGLPGTLQTLSNSYAAVRVGLTNNYTGILNLRGVVQMSDGGTVFYAGAATNNGTSIVATQNSATLTGSSGAFNNVGVGDNIYFAFNTFNVIQVNSSTSLQTDKVWPYVTTTNGWTNYPHVAQIYNSSPVIASAFTGDGSLLLSDGASGASVIWAYNTNNLKALMIDDVLGIRLVWISQNGAYPVSISPYAAEDSLMVLSNSWINVRYGLTNIDTSGPILIGGGLAVQNGGITNAGGIVSSGDDTNLSGNFVAGTAGKGLQIKAGSNARAGVSQLTAGLATVANTSVTSNTLVFVTMLEDSSLVGNIPTGWVVSNAPGTGFAVQCDAGYSGTNFFNWFLIETN